ncbi:MAG: O-antigen polymerase, partial [Gemmatimonadota bacterium]|nr:O-antigen polymerase [Gemmatimonadota bacterium]
MSPAPPGISMALPVRCGLVLALVLAGGAAVGDAVVAAGLGSAVIAAYPFVRGARRGDFDPLEPINGFVAYTIFTMLIRGWVDLHYGGPILGPRYRASSPEFRNLMAWVFGYTGMFLAAFMAAYYSRVGALVANALPAPRWRPLSRFGVSIALVASLLASLPAAVFLRGRLGAAIAEGSYLATSRGGGLSGVSFLLRFALVGAYLAVLYNARRAPRIPLLAACGYALLISLVVFTLLPTKIIVANTLVLLVGAVHYLRRPVTVRSLVVAACGGLLLVPIMGAYRYGQSPAEIWHLIKSLPSEPYLIIAGLFQRSFGADSFLVILDGVDHGRPLELGRTFAGLSWWWVPRALWHEKPLTYAIEFWATYLRQSAYFPPNVSASPSMIGELYLNFWWPGVLIGGCVAGWLYRTVYAWFQRVPRSEASVLIYMLTVAVMIKAVEAPIADHMTEVVVNVTICMVVLLGIHLLMLVSRLRPA